MGRKVVVLSGRDIPSCGPIGDLRNVFAIGSFDPDVDYFIDVETLESGVDESSESGKTRLPVKSIGYRDRQYFYATDYRFINAHGFSCVFPEERRLDIDVETEVGVKIVSLSFRGTPIFTSRARSKLSDATEEAAAWAKRQGDKFTYPGSIVEAMKSLDAFESRDEDEVERAVESDRRRSPGDSAMDHAFS